MVNLAYLNGRIFPCNVLYVCPLPNGTRLPSATICIVDTLPYIVNKFQEHDIEI